MEKVRHARRKVFRFLYEKRVQSPIYFHSKKKMVQLAEPVLLEAALAFGLEMGYLRRFLKRYQLTALGMLFVESLEGEEK